MTSPFIEKYGRGGKGNSLPPSTSPFVQKYGRQQDAQFIDVSDEDDGDGLFDYMGGFAKYLWSIHKTKPEDNDNNESLFVSYNRRKREEHLRRTDVVAQVGENIAKTTKQFATWLAETPASHLLPEAWQTIKDGVSEATGAAMKNGIAGLPGVAAQGLMRMFVETPVNLVTGTRRDEVTGFARPSTIDEQAQDLQSVIGAVVNLGVTRGVATRMMPVGKTTEEILKNAATSKIGRLFKAVKANTIGGVPGGAAQGLIEGAGNPEIDKFIVANTIGNMPLAIMFGALDYLGYNAMLNNAENVARATSNANVAELRALSELQGRANDSVDNLNAKVYGLVTGDDVQKAAAASKAFNGKPYVAVGLSESRIAEIQQSMSSLDAESAKPVDFQPSDLTRAKLDKNRYSIKGVEIRFATELDKLAYTIAGKKQSLVHDDMIQEAIEKTGLSKEAIISHGKSLREQAKTASEGPEFRVSRSQQEIDALNQKMVQDGRTKIAAMVEGETVTDATGLPWIRRGTTIESANGFKYPLDSQEASLIVGRSISKVDPASGVIKIGENSWNPTFGRITETKYNVIRGPRELTLFVPDGEITPKQQQTFEETGFLKGQRVVLADGREGIVSGYTPKKETDPNVIHVKVGKKIEYVQPQKLNAIIGDDHSFLLKSESLPVIENKTYIDELYSKFRTKYKIDQPNEEGFDTLFAKHMTENEVPLAAHDAIADNFYARLRDEIPTDPDDALINVRIKSDMEKMVSNRLDDVAFAARSALRANGMWVNNRNGAYHIYGGGTRLATVGSLEEILDFVSKTGTRPIPVIGKGGQFPPDAIHNIGGMAEEWKGDKLEANWVDRLVTKSPIGQAITPTGNYFQRLDAVIKDATGVPSNLFSVYQQIQDGAIKLRKAVHSLEPATKYYTEALKYKLKIPEARHSVIADWLGTASLQELLDGQYARPANATEIKFAKQLATLGTISDDISRVVVAASKDSKLSSFGTPQFGAAIEAMKGKTVNGIVFTDKMVKAAKLFNSTLGKTDLKLFSPALALELSDAYINPHAALSRKDFQLKMRMTPDEVKAAELLDKALKEGAPLLGIEPGRRIEAYFPHVKLNNMLGLQYADPTGSSAFMHDLHRLGLLTDENIIRDPFAVVFKYFMGGAKKLSGFESVEQLATSKVNSIAQQLADSPVDSHRQLAPGVQDYYSNYMQSVLGIPDRTTALAMALNKLSSVFGMRSQLIDEAHESLLGRIANKAQVRDLTNTSMAVAEAALQGGKPIFAVRDLISGIINTFSYYGSRFTGEAFMGGLSKEYMDGLVQRGVLPSLEIDDFISPNRAGGLAVGAGVAKRTADFAMNYSYQRQMYNKMAAGLYKASTSRTTKVMSDLVQGKITKVQAYDMLDVDIHGPAFIRQFDDIVQTGNVENAAHFLGKWDVKKLVNTWGYGNNPRYWNTGPGRVLGMYGSWGVNELQTLADLSTRGSPKKIAQRLGRFSAATAAVAIAGNEAELDLRNWITNPFKLFPTGGPILSFAKDALTGGTELVEGLMQGELNSEKLTRLLPFTTGDSIGRIYIPFSMMFQDWLQAYNMLDNNYSDVQVGARAIGIRPQK